MTSAIGQTPTPKQQPPPRPPREAGDAAPRSLAAFHGQRRAVGQLEVALAAYRREFEYGIPYAFPHVGLWGPPGLGKSQLVGVVAAELNVPLTEALGCSLSQPQAVNRLLIEAEAFSVLFIDEADELPQESQSVLLRAAEERLLLLTRGDGQVTRLPLVPFTLALASNRMHQVLPALRDRLHLNLQFEFYDAQTLAAVCADRADRLGWRADPEVANAIGRCGRGTPRQALRLLAACWRVARAEGAGRITLAHFGKACELEDIDPDLGLDRTERDYLLMLPASSVPVRPSVIASRLALPMRQVTEVTEAMLVRLGLIVRVPEGRGLTTDGTDLCRRLVAHAIGGAR